MSYTNLSFSLLLGLTVFTTSIRGAAEGFDPTPASLSTEPADAVRWGFAKARRQKEPASSSARHGLALNFDDTSKLSLFYLYEPDTGNLETSPGLELLTQLKETIGQTQLEQIERTFLEKENMPLSAISDFTLAIVDAEKKRLTLAGMGDSRGLAIQDTELITTNDRLPDCDKPLNLIAYSTFSETCNLYHRWRDESIPASWSPGLPKVSSHKLHGRNAVVLLASANLWHVFTNQIAGKLLMNTLEWKSIEIERKPMEVPSDAIHENKSNNKRALHAATALSTAALTCSHKDVSVLVAILNNDARFSCSFGNPENPDNYSQCSLV